MNKLIAVLFMAVVLLFPVAVFAEDSPVTVTQESTAAAQQDGSNQSDSSGSALTTTSTQSPVDSSGMRPVSPSEFVARFNRMVNGINSAVAGLIVPLATFALLVSVAVLSLGAILGSSTIKRYGFGGIFFTTIGLILFWGIPVFIGLIKSLAASFAG